jgi:hypothetical protein
VDSVALIVVLEEPMDEEQAAMLATCISNFRGVDVVQVVPAHSITLESEKMYARNKIYEAVKAALDNWYTGEKKKG